MFFKKKKELTEQEQYLYQLYKDRHILDEMLAQYKKDRQTLIDMLKDIVRHTKPIDRSTDWQITHKVFDDLHISWYWFQGDQHITASYKGSPIASDIAEDLYNLYRIVWGQCK
jgi:hypothetical protein